MASYTCKGILTYGQGDATSWASDFLGYRRRAAQALESGEVNEAKHSLRLGIALAARFLRPMLHSSLECLSGMLPLIETAQAFVSQFEALDDSLFNIELAEYSIIFDSLCAKIRPATVTAASPEFVCAACSSKSNLDEDVDNPGIFYCVPCWVEYSKSCEDPARLQKSHREVFARLLDLRKKAREPVQFFALW